MYQFGEILGNQRLLAHLQGALRQRKVSHAYLFLGAEGSGKMRIAETFAMRLQCEGEGTEPCGVCSSCKAFLSGNHPDIVYVRPTKKTLGVDDIREQILEDVKLKQYRYRYKIYIVEQADAMTVQAQNALLKTLEEPPSYGVFLLLAERMEAFLPTILSRTVVLKVRPLPEQQVADYLRQKKFVPDTEAAVLAAYAQGSIGRALSLLEDEGFSAMRQDILGKMEALPRASLAEVLLWAKDLEQYKGDLRFLDMMQLWYRDCLVAKRLKNGDLLIQQDKKEALFAAADASVAELANKAAAVETARRALAANGNFRLTMEVMLMQLKENETNDRSSRYPV